MQSNGISYLDLIIVIGLIIFLIRGFKRGFTEEFIQMLGTVVSLILATRYMSNLSHYLVDPVGIPTIGAIVIAFAVIFLVTFFTFRYLATQMRKAVNVSVALGGIDKIVGAAFGLAKGAIFISLFVILLSFFEIFPFVSRYTNNSALYHPMRRVAPLAYDALKVFVPQSKPFITELKDTTSGISYDKQGETTRKMLEYYRKK
jgi:membrane protein required for colicin V production